MKQPIDHAENATTPEDQLCSEKKCVTCFENRGCIYEQYLIAMTHNIERSYRANRTYPATQQLGTQVPA
jgi:hypothetical protein